MKYLPFLSAAQCIPYAAARTVTAGGEQIVNTMHVARGAFSLENPWAAPASAASIELTTSKNGKRPRLGTRVHVWRDELRLYVLFDAEDDHIEATLRGHDTDLWTEDVFEIFIAPRSLDEYYEIEVNPVGTIFDARVSSPDLSRATMKVDRSWTCRELWQAIRTRRTDGTVERVQALIALPFSSLATAAPAPGEHWRANFYRIDRSPLGDAFSAWSPTMADPPDFHVPERFGRLEF